MLNERVKGENRNVERSRAASTSERKQKLLKAPGGSVNVEHWKTSGQREVLGYDVARFI